MHRQGSQTALELAIYSAHAINSSYVPVNIIIKSQEDQQLIYGVHNATDFTNRFTCQGRIKR